MTFGLGGDLTMNRAHKDPPQISSRPATGAPSPSASRISHRSCRSTSATATGGVTSAAGIGTSTWSVVPDGEQPQAPDTEHLETINYGGGARWFIKRHLAFSFDVRFYAINPTTPLPGRPAGPRTTLLSIGGGISVK